MDAIQKTHFADDDTLAHIAKLERELAEEARLNGMGSEREAKLMAERDRAVQYAVALRENLIGIQFAASGYCPACGGWNANPADRDRGCTPGWHTRECWLRAAIDKAPEGGL